tara:strand:- start:616 stop:2277 length:1662 start_codon:yes stop_codon:yes gene_type:complete
MNNSNEYIVLARKYRPQKFIDLVGQEMLVQILSNAIPNNRLAHAYVLTGVRGVGKTTTARLIAMSLNCTKREENSCEPCGNCDSCKASGVDSNLDVIEMDAASNTGVDDVREIIENVKYKPVIGEYKIFIIDEVHMLSKNAFNALLKTLEEPPEHVKFIFATTEVKKIPITVLSRCQRFDLHRIDNKNLSKYLQKIAALEKIEIDNEAISLIVRSADGSIRDALSLLDQANSNNLIKIDVKSITAMLGLAERSKIYDLLDKILIGNVGDSLKKYRNLYELGADVNMIFDELLNVTHYITQIKISPNMKNDIFVPETERIKGSEIASKLSLNDISIIWQILFKGFQELQEGIHLFQHGEMIILRIIYFFDNNNPDKPKIIKNKNHDDSNESNNTNKDNLDKIDNEINNSEALSEDKKNFSISNYREFVDMFFKNREGLLHSKLYNDVSLVSFKEGEIIINSEKINDPSFNRIITKLISKWTGRIWSINSSSSNLGKSLYEEDIINQQKEIEIMKNTPIVKKILFEFPQSKIHSITDLGEINNSEDIKESKIKKE